MPNASSRPLADDFHARVRAYQPTAAHNDHLHADFTALTWADPLLAAHRSYVEKNKLGFGDAAFHALWARLLAATHERFASPRALEIGVFKGQVISLWALLARHFALPLEIHAITPLQGDPPPPLTWWKSVRAKFDRRFRERLESGDFYELLDYETIVRALFSHYSLSFDDIVLHRGFSTDPACQQSVTRETFHLIYIDGDHTYDGVRADILYYAPKIAIGGWLVMDDAAYDQPGTTFWKGYKTVARACHLLPALGFRNVLNIGHNRVFEHTGVRS